MQANKAAAIVRDIACAACGTAVDSGLRLHCASVHHAAPTADVEAALGRGDADCAMDMIVSSAAGRNRALCIDCCPSAIRADGGTGCLGETCLIPQPHPVDALANVRSTKPIRPRCDMARTLETIRATAFAAPGGMRIEAHALPHGYAGGQSSNGEDPKGKREKDAVHSCAMVAVPRSALGEHVLAVNAAHQQVRTPSPSPSPPSPPLPSYSTCSLHVLAPDSCVGPFSARRCSGRSRRTRPCFKTSAVAAGCRSRRCRRAPVAPRVNE